MKIRDNITPPVILPHGNTSVSDKKKTAIVKHNVDGFDKATGGKK